LGFAGDMLQTDVLRSDGQTLNPEANLINAYRQIHEVLGSASAGIDKLESYGVGVFSNRSPHDKIFFNIYKTELNLPEDFEFKL